MATAHKESAAAKLCVRASIVTSLLLLAAAAFQWNVTFWLLVMTNFALFHAVWLIQLVQLKKWGEVDWRLARWPLVVFAVLGNLAVLLWGQRLLAVFTA